MKKITLIALAFAFTTAVWAQENTTKQTTSEAKPVEVKDINKYVEFKNADYDFGKIPFGKPSEYQLTIKNISKDTVTLERVQVGCGCTTPKYEAGKKIAPKGSYEVTLGFNGSTDGPFTKYVTIFLNDNMSKQITFKGETYKTPDASAPANAPVEKMKGSN